MDWLLALLAASNTAAMYTVFYNRDTPARSVPWGKFFSALITTELAWLWLPVQAVLVLLLATGGATGSFLGELALTVILFSWLGLGWCLWQSSKAPEVISAGLTAGLGTGYEQQIPESRRALLRREVRFEDWKNPVGWARPGVEVIRGLPYGPHGVRQTLDIYRPRQLPEGGCPVLLQIHGGAWMLGDKGSQALPLMYHMAEQGWICVAVNYRLSPSVGFPTHIEDCKKALCWIRERGADYGMDTDFVAVTGGSAGGHLTALMALTANDPALQREHPGVDTSLQAAVPFYGVYDFCNRHNQHRKGELISRFLEGRVFHQKREDNPDLWDQMSPIARITPDAPPMMVLHGTHDSLVPVAEGRVFAQRLREVSQQPVAYVEMPGAEHAWEIISSLRTEHTVDGVHRFLEWALARHQATDTQPAAEAEPAAEEEAVTA